MTDPQPSISKAFQLFSEAPRHAQAWLAAVKVWIAPGARQAGNGLSAVLAACAWKVEYLSCTIAKQAGASREEVISAILVGLPAAGLGVTQVLPTAIAAYDAT
jgi:hypothetical protein